MATHPTSVVFQFIDRVTSTLDKMIQRYTPKQKRTMKNQPNKKVRKRTQLRAQGYRFDHDIGDWTLHPKYGKRLSAVSKRALAVLREGM